MICFHIAEGLGNIIETTPTFNYLKWRFPDEKIIIHCHEKFAHNARIVYKDHAEITTKKPNCRTFTSICLEDCSKWPHKKSEVEMNLIRAGCKSPGIADKMGFCGFEEQDTSYDVLLCNGYSKTSKIESLWEVKSWPFYEELAYRLGEKFKVASIGLSEEYITGTENETQIGLEKTLGLIKNSRLLISNDTGLYHAANVFGVENIALFTMTSLQKNFDSEFHRHTTILKTDLPCQPCQYRSKHFWMQNRNNCGWACRNIDIETVLDKALEVLDD